MEFSNQLLILLWIGFIGLFIMSFQMMSEGMEKVFGRRIRMLDLPGHGLWKDIFYGVSVSAIVQSSSATMGALLGFANTGVVTLEHALGMIIGANLGTLITIQLFSFSLESVAPILLICALGVRSYAESERVKAFAQWLIGISAALLSLSLVKMISIEAASNGFMSSLAGFYSGHPLDVIFGVFVGFVMSAVLRSGTITISLMMAISLGGFFDAYLLVPIIIGANIGSCISAMIASVNGAISARRVAMLHLIFNLSGAILIGGIFLDQTVGMFPYLGVDDARRIANLQVLFNVSAAVMMIVFKGPMVILLEKVMIEKDDHIEDSMGSNIDIRLLSTPSLALTQVTQEAIKMAGLAHKVLIESMRAFVDMDSELVRKVFEQEKEINRLEHSIIDFLINLSNASSLSQEDRRWVDQLFSTVNDIERVGDHSENLAELAIERIEKKLHFSESALDELVVMHELVCDAFMKSIRSMTDGDGRLASEVIEQEKVIDEMEKSLRKTHIRRLNEGGCHPGAGVIFLDIISNLERVGDHSSNIAIAVCEHQSNGIYFGRKNS